MARRKTSNKGEGGYPAALDEALNRPKPKKAKGAGGYPAALDEAMKKGKVIGKK